MMANGEPITCPWCAGRMRMRYPGNDPECGPARLTCGYSWCERAREAVDEAMRYSLNDTTLDELHAEALNDDATREMYELPVDLCGVCDVEVPQHEQHVWFNGFDIDRKDPQVMCTTCYELGATGYPTAPGEATIAVMSRAVRMLGRGR